MDLRYTRIFRMTQDSMPCMEEQVADNTWFQQLKAGD